MSEEKRVDASHKVIVRVSKEVYSRLEELARLPALELRLVNETDAPRYAEITRVLLANEFVRRKWRAPLQARVAVAVLSNSTLILAAAFAKLTYGLQEELAGVSSTVTRTTREELARLRAGERKSKRVRGKNPAPVVNLTFDGWLYRELIAFAREIPDDEFDTSSYRSRIAYAVNKLLPEAVARDEVEELILTYAKAVARVRTALEEAVVSERDVVREYLRMVRPPS